MSFLSIIEGGAEAAAGFGLEAASWFLAQPELAAPGAMLIGAGIGSVISGVGSLIAGGPAVAGFATATRNPISPWTINYGYCRPKPALIYEHAWGDNNDILDQVFILGAHSSASVDELKFDQQRVQIDTTAIPTSAAAGYTLPWAVQAGSGTSFTPVQQSINITSIVRFNDVVTVVIPQDIPYLQAGDPFKVQNITGDLTLNGTFPVAEIISRVPSGGTNILTFTYLCGGTATTVDNEGQIVTLWANYGRQVYMEVLNGSQTLGQTFVGMTAGTPYLGTGKLITPASPGPAGGTAAPNPWTADCSCMGKTAVFIRVTGNATYFAAGLPQISFLIHGKNDIYDPRTATYGWTNNAALCIADFLTNQTWGFKFAYGDTADVPTTALSAAANECDVATALASGGTEPRYTCNGQFEVTQGRGQTLDDLLTSCAGRRVEINGQQYIFPGTWTGPGNAVNLTSMASAPFTWYPTQTIRDLYNGCKGTYISPANKWQSTDYPYYAQDTQHGYSGPSMYDGDANLAADGGDRRWLELPLRFTTSSSQAQRTAKIELLRRRFGATGTFPLNMAGYQFAPLDVIQATVPALAFSGEFLEVQKCRLNLRMGGGRAPLFSTEIDVQKTDSSIYDWVTEEELTPQGYVQTSWPAAQVTETEARPWSPGYVSPLAGDAIGGAASFGLQPVYGVDTQGNATASLQIKGKPAINDLDTVIAMPQLNCAPLTTGGSLAPGTYVLGLTAYDSGASNHGNSDYLALATVVVGGTGSGSIDCTIVFGSGDDGGDIYMAAYNANGYVFHYQQSVASGSTSATVTSFNQSTPGGPDKLFDHFSAMYLPEIHAGDWANQIVSVTATTITIGGDSMTLNQWAGYTLSLLAKYDPTVEIPVLNIPIASSTASSGGEFILTIGPGADGNTLPDLTTLLAPLDLVVMRGRYTFTANSFSDPNVANPYYPSGATGVEAGHIAVVLSGADAIDIQRIASVSNDAYGHATIFNLQGEWNTTPATGDIVVICSAAQGPPTLSPSLVVRNSAVAGGTVVQPNVQNLARQTCLFWVETQDVNGNAGPTLQMRDVYLFGATNTLPLLMLSVNGTLAIQSDAAPAVYLPADRTPSGAAAYVKQAPVGAPLNMSLYAGSTLWLALSIPAGSQQVVIDQATCDNAGPIPAATQLRLSIDGVGTTSPGSDLSLFLYR